MDTPPTQNKRKKSQSVSEQRSCEVLRGVVAVVEVGSEVQTSLLRATLAALGATILPRWDPLVTHVVWSEGGCREARALARGSAAHVVSPPWVKACAVQKRRVPEKTFPAATRPSDLPSPNTLLNLLKQADQDNVPLPGVTPANAKKSRSMENPDSTVSSSRAESREPKAASSGRRTRGDSSATDVESRVNTRPRRALPRSTSPRSSSPRSSSPRSSLPRSRSPAGARSRYHKPEKSKRKLFTQREVEELDASSDDGGIEEETGLMRLPRPTRADHARARDAVVLSGRPDPPGPRSQSGLPSQSGPRSQSGPPSPRSQSGSSTRSGDLFSLRYQPSTSNATQGAARAPAMPEGFVPRPGSPVTQSLPQLIAEDNINSRDGRFRIVLTGMVTEERLRVYREIKKLRAKVQKSVNYKTTHVVVGTSANKQKINSLHGRGGASSCPDGGDVRTLKALDGAARGCRVVFPSWVFESAHANRWLPTDSHRVPYLRDIAENAYVERRALNLMQRDYAFNVFQGRRVKLSVSSKNRHAAEHLLAICGAVIVDDASRVTNNGALEDEIRDDGDITFDGGNAGTSSQPYGWNIERPGPSRPVVDTGVDEQEISAWRSFFRWRWWRKPLPRMVTVGVGEGQTQLRWVFDSVAAGRMLATRGYRSSAG